MLTTDCFGYVRVMVFRDIVVVGRPNANESKICLPAGLWRGFATVDVLANNPAH
jgi:hypothetical protein